MVERLYPAPLWAWTGRRALVRHWLRDPLEGLSDFVPHQILRLLPTEAGSAFGARMGLRGGMRRVEASGRARALFRALRPEADAAAIEALLAAHWSHIGRCFGEFAGLHRFWAEGRIEVSGEAHLRAVHESGRPLVVAGLHVGNWEVVHAGLSGLGIPFSGIYQRLPNRFRMRIADAARRRSWRAGAAGTALAPTPAALFRARGLLEASGSTLLYYVDEYWKGRVHAPALGRPLRAEGNIMRAVRLAAGTGAAVVPAYALRIGASARFRLHFLPEVPLAAPGAGRRAALVDLAALDAVIEGVVRAHPEQWLMAHVFRPDR